jgi:DNA-directed RNA polymerase subunit F
MTNPEFIEESTASLIDVKKTLEEIEKRDKDLNYRSNKAKEFLDQFCVLTQTKKKDLHKKLVDLKLTRLKEEHITKIVDFLPSSANDLKIVLQAYPLSMPKKDQDAIVNTVKEFI